MKHTTVIIISAIMVVLTFTSCKKDNVRGCPTQLAKITDGKGDMVAKYTYDDNGILIQVVYPDDLGNEFIYQSGRLSEVRQSIPNGGIVNNIFYAYDSLGRMVSYRTENAKGKELSNTYYAYTTNTSRSIFTLSLEGDTLSYETQLLDAEGNILQNSVCQTIDTMQVLIVENYTYDDKKHLQDFQYEYNRASTHNIIRKVNNYVVYAESDTVVWTYTYNEEGYPLSRTLVSERDPRVDSSSYTTKYIYGCD